ncbi:MAG: hypothetical protein KKF00_02495, partial [Proteobacteria bacterium]|nr:hypothetical protein [Pseudomonadota bacterium]
PGILYPLNRNSELIPHSLLRGASILMESPTLLKMINMYFGYTYKGTSKTVDINYKLSYTAAFGKRA